MAVEAALPLDTAFEVELPPAPYPGLRPFEKHEWPIFFGREEMADEVIHRLIQQHLVVVHGDSGCGKSSLIRAGVLAQLEQEHARSGVRWRTCAMLPREAPLRNLANELAGLNADHVDRDRIRQIRRCLNLGRDAPAALAELLRRGEDDHICILIDQFEELFSFAREHGRDEAQLFVDILVGLHAKPPPGLYAILTMRSEFLGVCARFQGLAEAVNRTQYLLPQMERPALMRAIREPATLYEGEVTCDLAERLIADAGGGQDQLPLIQHGLMLLWRRKAGPLRGLFEDERSYVHPSFELAEAGMPFRYEDGAAWRLGLEDYQGSGLATLLSDHADEVMAAAASDAEREKIVEHLFRALIDTNAEGSAIRRPQTFGELMAVTGSDEQTLRDIIDRFRADGVSFLRPYGNDEIRRETEIDISHEALIRCWAKIADGKDGWLQREFRDGLIWKTLRMQAQRGETLSATATDTRDAWLKTLPASGWARRYDDGWDDVQRLIDASRNAAEEDARRRKELEEFRRREAEERARQAEWLAEEERLRSEEERLRLENELEQQAWRARLEQQALRTRLALAAAVVGAILTAIATGAFWYAHGQKLRAHAAAEQALAEAKRADEAVIETKASSLWSRLQLWRDPLTPEEVATLWDLTQQDQEVRAAFVRQLADDPVLLRRFGFKPQPIARAVGLRWPDDARQTFKRSMAYVASDEFDPTDPFELVSYTRTLAALMPWLDGGIANAARRNIESAINAIARQERLSDQQLWGLPEAVEVGAAFWPPLAIEPARDRLREIIRTAAPAADAGWRGHSISRAIQVMNPVLTDSERRRAVGYLLPLLGQNPDLWSAKAVPRALIALLPTLEADRTAEILNEVPQAIASVAVANAAVDSSYLLALMQVVETLGNMAGGEPLVAAFSQALTRQLALPNDPLQRAALARAAVPLLERHGDSTPSLLSNFADLVSKVAEITLVQQGTGTLQDAEAALRQALPGSDGPPERAQAALDFLHADWTAEPTPNAGPNPYRLAAQARLLAMLAPSVMPDLAARAAEDLLAMLPDTQDYLSREAIARALAALAPKLSDARRDEALSGAKTALAKTGSSEEASAWAGAIAALLPDDPRAATAEIVEALKYPTATGAPTDVLLAALATPWPEEFRTIAGRPLDGIVVNWLEAHLPQGYSLAEPPTPAALRSDGTGRGRG